MDASDGPRNLDERRKLVRFDLQAPARIEVSKEAGHKDVLSLMTRDISSMGAYVQTAQPLAEGQTVKLELLLSLDMLKRLSGEKGNARIKVRGKVIRSDAGGMAIAFDTRFKIMSTSETGF
jgi:hypothetical protein